MENDLVSFTAEKANELRKTTLEMCVKAGTGHVTSCMSCAEILAVLYYGEVLRQDSQNPKWKDRDRFILSKGQASPILYAVLADRGFFPVEHLDQFVKGVDGTGKDAPFGVHLQCTVPGVEFTTGSLGHGLGYAVGTAEAAKMDGKNHSTIVLMGDGEVYEGSNWEVAGYASHHRLSNLTAIVDRNQMCTNNYTEKIVSLEPFADKWRAFGWDVQEVNGHSVKELLDVFENAHSSKGDRPHMIIAHTIKGQGIPSMQRLYTHGTAPEGKGAELARRELEEFSKEHGGYNVN